MTNLNFDLIILNGDSNRESLKIKTDYDNIHGISTIFQLFTKFVLEWRNITPENILKKKRYA